MRLVTCDTSTTCSGMAFFNNGKLEDYAELKPKEKDINERMYIMADLIQTGLKQWKPDVVFIETPQGHGANVKLARNLGMMLGVVMGWCAANQVEFHEVAPSQWRSWAGWSQGKLTRPELKKMSIEKVNEKYGIDVGDDVADAINIGEGVLAYCDTGELFE